MQIKESTYFPIQNLVNADLQLDTNYKGQMRDNNKLNKTN